MMDRRQGTTIALLNSTTFVLAFGGESHGVIDIYTIIDQLANPSQEDYRKIGHVATFQLPPYDPGVGFHAVCCEISYGRPYIHPGDEEQPSSVLPFEVSPQACLLHLKVIYFEPGFRAEAMGPGDYARLVAARHIFSLKPFLEAVDAYRAGTLDIDEDGDPLLTPWVTWGPLNSRMFRSAPGIDFTINLSCYGSRVHFKASEVDFEAGDVMMDFNTLHEARNGLGEPNPSHETAYLFVDAQHPTTISRGNMRDNAQH